MRVFILIVVYSITFDPYLMVDQTCYTGCFSGSQGQGQTTGIDFRFVRMICLIITKLGIVVATKERIIHCIYTTLFLILHQGAFVRSCFLRTFFDRSSISQILHHISFLLVNLGFTMPI